MTFVNNNQVKKDRRELFVNILLFLSTGHRLVERQVDFIGFVGLTLFNLGHRLTKWLEVVCLGLVNQDVTVS